jgi:hypothetical protein
MFRAFIGPSSGVSQAVVICNHLVPMLVNNNTILVATLKMKVKLKFGICKNTFCTVRVFTIFKDNYLFLVLDRE